jgi:hypothetical protein
MANRTFNVGGTIPGTHPKISSFPKLALPVTTALTGAYVLGGTMALSLRNRANAALPMLAVGSPTIDPLFGATVQHEACFDTLLTPSTDRTWIVVYKPQVLTGTGAANKAPLLGNQAYVASNIRGDQMWLGDSACYNQADRNNTTPVSAAQLVSGLDTSKWAASVGIVDSVNGIDDSARRQLGTRTWVAPTTSFTPGTRATYNGRNIRVGGDGTGTPGLYSRSVTVGMVIVHEAVLTHTQVDQQLDYVSAWLAANYGITDL